MTSLMPIFWLTAIVLSALCKLYGGRAATKLVYPSAAALLAAAVPLPARYQLLVFAVALFFVATLSLVKRIFTKKS